MDWMILDDLILAPTAHITQKNFTSLFEPSPQPHFQKGTWTLEAFVSFRNNVSKTETQKMALLNKTRTIIVENIHEYYAYV